MAKSNSFKAGRHFLQIPGPTNLPDRVLRAMDRAVIDHRGPEFAEISKGVLEKLKSVFKTTAPVIMYPGSGTGAWESAIVNTLNVGDKVLFFETGEFSIRWYDQAKDLKLDAEIVPGDWRHGIDPKVVAERLAADKDKKIKAVCVLHNETSTGIVNNIGEIRKAIDSVNHPALFMVDVISSLASIDYRHEEWKVDVTIGGSQKGLLLPPGLSFNAISHKALEASKKATMPKHYWDWNAMLENNKTGLYPYTPATNLIYGLDEALDMLMEEGLDNVFARHARLAEATRLAVKAWGLEILCKNPAEYSNTLTTVLLPEGYDADNLRKTILDEYNMSLGASFRKVQGKVFRIGHLGDLNEIMLMGVLSGVEMGLTKAKVPFKAGGIMAALQYLSK
ncbi:MAG: aminotransferase class V-fold PLP-dependent enzyme [Proteobacteria bacterium]|nr:aminotransferase class V-fold PLP-dependent enzyme [Pseudomonadota bacterium]